MNSSTPLMFRASSVQRAIAVTLVLGCFLVAGRGVSLMIQNVPRIWYQLKLAQSQGGEPTALIWLSLVLACATILIAGVVLLFAMFALMLIEGTQVIVDELGITVECPLFPGPIARRFGAGRIPWKNITRIERRKMCFVLHGHSEPNCANNSEIVRFLLVDRLDYLIFIIMERSPDIKLDP